MSSVAIFLIVASSLVGQTPAEPPGAAQMKDFADLTAGKWVGESVVDFDYPDVCKKGDKVITQFSKEWVLDGTALMTKVKYDINGKTVGKSVVLAGWDISRDGIRTRGFGTLGGTTQGVWKKQGGKWRHRVQGILPGDVKHGGVVTVTIVDAYTQIHKATQRTMAGEELPDVETEFKRVK